MGHQHCSLQPLSPSAPEPLSPSGPQPTALSPSGCPVQPAQPTQPAQPGKPAIFSGSSRRCYRSLWIRMASTTTSWTWRSRGCRRRWRPRRRPGRASRTQQSTAQPETQITAASSRAEVGREQEHMAQQHRTQKHRTQQHTAEQRAECTCKCYIESHCRGRDAEGEESDEGLESSSDISENHSGAWEVEASQPFSQPSKQLANQAARLAGSQAGSQPASQAAIHSHVAGRQAASQPASQAAIHSHVACVHMSLLHACVLHVYMFVAS